MEMEKFDQWKPALICSFLGGIVLTGDKGSLSAGYQTLIVALSLYLSTKGFYSYQPERNLHSIYMSIKSPFD